MNHKYWAVLAALMGAMFIFVSPAHAETPIGPLTINDTRTWNLAGSPYIVQGVVIVGVSGRLTIDPGVVVKFTSGNYLSVYGELTAQGDSSHPILFTSNLGTPKAGDWRGLFFHPGSQALVKHCELSYGGYGNEDGVSIMSSDVTLDSCSIHHNQDDGVSLEGAGLSPTLQNLTLENNGQAAIRQTSGATRITYGAMSMTGNRYNGVVLDTSTLAQEGVWDSSLMGYPFIAAGWQLVSAGVTLTIRAGTTVQFTSGNYLTVYGNLLAEGTDAQPILLTSAAASPQAGDWRGLFFHPGSRALVKHCELSYGGYGNEDGVSIMSSQVTLENCSIHHNREDAVSLEGEGLAPVLENLDIQENGAAAVRMVNPGSSMEARNILASGNHPDAVATGGTLNTNATWNGAEAGLPFELASVLVIPSGKSLTLSPGTQVQATSLSYISVNGTLYALGSTTQPISFTGSTETPGFWRGVFISGGTGLFQYCRFAYGGGAGSAMLEFSGLGMLQNCTLQHALGDGLRVSNANPYLANNRIEANGFGLRNTTPVNLVDARSNYWGHPSGPTHASNPSGSGQPVSDGVLFDPWLTSPEEGGIPTGDLILSVGGPVHVSPGQTADLGVFYMNAMTQTVEDAVLVLVLPDGAQLVDAQEGIDWAERGQVFWKLGSVPPGAWDTLSVRVKFRWGLPAGLQDDAMVLMGGSNLPQQAINWQEYLDYTPVVVAARAAMTDAQAAAERLNYPQVDALAQAALQQGYGFAAGQAITMSNGAAFSALLYILPDEGKLFSISREGDQVLASIFDASTYAVRDVTGGMTITNDTGEYRFWGSWTQPAADAAAAPEAPTAPTYRLCFRNCLIKAALGYVVEKMTIEKIPLLSDSLECKTCFQNHHREPCLNCANFLWEKVAGIKAPLIDEYMRVQTCQRECRTPSSHVCTQDVVECPNNWLTRKLSPLFRYYWVWRCDKSSGLFIHLELKSCLTALDGKPKCIKGYTSPVQTPCKGPCKVKPKPKLDTLAPTLPCDQVEEDGIGCDSLLVEVRTPRDPNEKFGPIQDVLPGQVMTYTITYENEGTGTAYGVYILDELSEALDEGTLQPLTGDWIWLEGSRTLAWNIGELAPKGEPGSSGVVTFTARLKDGLPAGTVVTNQAVVYFPTVPEETPTNTIVNVIRPLIARSQSVQTPAQTAVNITLSGAGGGGSLTYQVASQPRYGVLSGAAPALVYTPQANFTGEDTFQFTVSQGSDRSQPAEVQIIVNPSQSDRTPPGVSWSRPAPGEEQVAAPAQPYFSDENGNAYLPQVIIQFSEALDADTVNAGSIQLMDQGGKVLSATVDYIGFNHQAALTPRQALEGGAWYTVSVNTAVKDASGNGLAAGQSWQFKTAEAIYTLLLPMIRR